MTPTIAWLVAFISSYPLLKYLVIFFGVGFGGEVAVISLSFLSAQNVFSLFPFFVIGVLGTLTADSLWFWLGKTKTAGKIIDHRYATYTLAVIMEAIRKISRGNHLLAFIFAKFLVGTRIVVILYVSKTNISFKHFIYNDLVAILIWLTTLTSIGFLSGLGFAYLSRILKNVYAGIGFILLILLIIVMAQIWLKKFFTKEGEEIVKDKIL